MTKEQTFIPITIAIYTVVLEQSSGLPSMGYILFFFFNIMPKQIIDCLKVVSLLELLLTHFQWPLTSGICHSGTSVHNREEGERLHQKQMPKFSWYGLGQSDHHC